MGQFRHTVRSNFDLSTIDEIIRQALPDCTLWGDLDISEKEYEIILFKIKERLGEGPSFPALKYIFKRYPSVLVTSLVGFVLHDYKSNFWEGWGRILGVTLNVSNCSEIGRTALAHLRDHGFEVIEEEGYAYVSPILYQAGVSAGSFFRLFSVIDSTLGTRSFSPREIVIELTGNKSSLIDVSVRRYFQRNQEDAVQLVEDLREMMRLLAGLKEESSESYSSAWPDRIWKQYWNWRSDSRLNIRKKSLEHQIYFSPQMVYDEIQGICIRLPEQTLRDDSIYCLRWEIQGKGPHFDQVCSHDVHRVEDRNVTLSTLVPIPPAEEYTISVYDDDKDSAPLCSLWILSGITRDMPFLVFDSQGRPLSEKTSLHRKGTTAVWIKSVVGNREYEGVFLSEIYLQRSWSLFDGAMIHPVETSASFTMQTPSGNYRLPYHPDLDFELSDEPTLFDDVYSDQEAPVLTKFPNLVILGTIEEDHRFLKEGQLLLRSRDTGERHTVKLSDLTVNMGEDFAVAALRDWAMEVFHGSFGSYSLSIHQGRINRKSLSFYYSPSLPYRADIRSFRTWHDFDRKEPALYVLKDDLEKLSFDEPAPLKSEVLIERTPWIRLQTRGSEACISGIFKHSDQTQIPFRKILRPLDWNFWAESGETDEEHDKARTFSLAELKETTWRMQLRFADPSIRYDKITLNLTSEEGSTLQKKELRLDSRGRCHVTLNLFQTTLQNSELPLYLMLEVSQGMEDYQLVPLAAFRHFVQLKEPRYMTAGGRPVIIWQKGDFRQTQKLKLIALTDPSRKETVEQSLEKLQSFTKKGQSFHGIYLDAQLQDGVYFIDTIEEDPFSFFEEEETPISYDSHHILFVNAEKYLMAHYDAKTREAGKWMAAAVVAQYKLEWIQELSLRLTSLLAEKGYQNIWHFDVEKSADMLFSAVLSTFGPSDLDPEARTLMKEVYMSLSEEVISSRQRTRLLQILSESSFSTAEIRYLIQELQLYLFMPDGETLFSKKQLYRIWGIHEKLAILINIRNSAENPKADIGRIIHHLGEDTLKAVISIQSQNCGSYSWSECFECLFLNQGNCHGTRFKNLERVTGDGGEFLKLFSVSGRRRDPMIRRPTREDTRGYPVLGRTYLDLLFEYCQTHNHEKSRDYFHTAMASVPHLDAISARHEPYTRAVETILARRRDSANDIGRLFFQIGRASLYSALETRGIIQHHETKKLLPFWRVAQAACPDLVYRDLIMAELYASTEGGR